MVVLGQFLMLRDIPLAIPVMEIDGRRKPIPATPKKLSVILCMIRDNIHNKEVKDWNFYFEKLSNFNV